MRLATTPPGMLRAVVVDLVGNSATILSCDFLYLVHVVAFYEVQVRERH